MAGLTGRQPAAALDAQASSRYGQAQLIWAW